MVPGGLILASGLLRCPVCGDRLTLADGALRCPSRHTFDVSRYGYVSLLGGRRAVSGDDDDMARARERFLGTGAYAPVREAVVAATDGIPPREQGAVALDVGAGTGYYLAGVLDHLPGSRGIALDTSVRSLRAAARAHPRALAATWDAFEPFPLPDGGVDVVLDVFSPRNPPEFRRVLRPEGRLVVARPTARHLAELRREVPAMVAVDPAKEERLSAALDPDFVAGTTREVEYAISLGADSARDLIGMTPSARHVDLADPLAAAHDESLEVTVSVLVTDYAPRPPRGRTASRPPVPSGPERA